MKIVLAHPGVGPFVQQTARALLEAGLLASYWTTFADQPEARWRQVLIQLASLIGANLEQELGRRAVREVPASFLRRAPYWEIIRSLLTKMRCRSANYRPCLGARDLQLRSRRCQARA